VKKVILGINKRSSKLYPFRFNGRGHDFIKTHVVSIHGSDVSIIYHHELPWPFWYNSASYKIKDIKIS